MHLLHSKSSHEKVINKRSHIVQITIEFTREAHKSPTFVCCVCHRLMFENQGKLFKLSAYKDDKFVSRCVTKEFVHFNCEKPCSDDCSGQQFIYALVVVVTLVIDYYHYRLFRIVWN